MGEFEAATCPFLHSREPGSMTRQHQLTAFFLALLGVVAIHACGRSGSSVVLPPAGVALATGTWGGDNAGLIVDDTIAHVHVGCTFGNFPAPVVLDESGRFNVSGSYMLHAYPIAVGPSSPAQLAGVLQANRLTLTVAVNDTVEKKLVVLGPVVVLFARDPKLGPCPICRVPRPM